MEVKRNPPEPERLVSVFEAGDQLGLSHWTVRDLIKKGVITSHKLRSRRLIPMSEINRLIEESRRPATKELAVA